MVHMDRDRCNWQLALYAVHLAAGNNILCQSLKSATVGIYLWNVATLCMAASPAGRDPRKVRDSDSLLAPCISRVLKEIKRWEKIPDRKEPFTPAMLQHLVSRVEQQLSPPTDSVDHLDLALRDWFDLGGCYAGLRLSEWAQPISSDISAAAKRHGALLPTAFVLADFHFELQSGRRVPASRLDCCAAADVAAVIITWRTQKNGQNGEFKRFLRNTLSSFSYPVTAAINIVRRFVSLIGLRDDIPLAVFFNRATGGPFLINKNMIDDCLQSIAAELFSISDPTELSRWTSHSLRIGACVLLHSYGFSETQLKFILRWRSNAFMDYLRNSDIIATKQNTAISMAADGTMPSFSI